MTSEDVGPRRAPSTALPRLFRALSFLIAAIAPLVLATVARALVARGPTAFGGADLVLGVLGLASVGLFAFQELLERRSGRVLADGGFFPGRFPLWPVALVGFGACAFTTADAVGMWRALNAGGVAGSPFSLLAGFFMAVASGSSGAYGAERVEIRERAVVFDGTPVPWRELVRYGWTDAGELRLEVRARRREPVWTDAVPVSPAVRARFDEILARHATPAAPPGD